MTVKEAIMPVMLMLYCSLQPRLTMEDKKKVDQLNNCIHDC